jgi:ABC-type lipoprotein release transport system permease subunit
LALRKIGALVWADMRMRPETFLFCMALSLILAFLSSIFPAYRAARINIAEALRFTG